MTTQTQPAPVLPWHREAAKQIHPLQKCTTSDDEAWQVTMEANETIADEQEGAAAIIAQHDPHAAQNATTVRLLEESFTVVSNLGSTLAMISSPDTRWESPMMQQYREYRDRVRAHLAALQQEGAAK